MTLNSMKIRKGMEIQPLDKKDHKRYLIVDYDISNVYYIDLNEVNFKTRTVYKMTYEDLNNYKRYW